MHDDHRELKCEDAADCEKLGVMAVFVQKYMII
jgi:hypothetical protein